MTAQTLDGELVASGIKADLAERVAVLVDNGHTPGLGTLLVGDDGPSVKYISMKHRDCEAVGLASYDVRLSADAGQADVDAVVDEFNTFDDVDAYLVQYPFPASLDYEAALMRVDPTKDADGLHPVNLGRLVQGIDAPLACTPAGIVKLLEHYSIPLADQHVVIVGRGLTIGRPLANLLSLKRPNLNAVVTVVHTGVSDLARYTRHADVLVAAAGAPGLITADMVKPGAVVVAAGASYEGKKLLSDVTEDVAEVASWLSPRLGGVGPMTRAMLLANTVAAAERRVLD